MNFSRFSDLLAETSPKDKKKKRFENTKQNAWNNPGTYITTYYFTRQVLLLSQCVKIINIIWLQISQCNNGAMRYFMLCSRLILRILLERAVLYARLLSLTLCTPRVTSDSLNRDQHTKYVGVISFGLHHSHSWQHNFHFIFYRCTVHLDTIKVLHLPTDALYISLTNH